VINKPIIVEPCRPFSQITIVFIFIEYNSASLTKALYQVFVSACSEILDDIGSMSLQKNAQSIHVSMQAVRNRRRRMEDRHLYYTDLNSLFDTTEVCILLLRFFSQYSLSSMRNIFLCFFVFFVWKFFL